MMATCAPWRPSWAAFSKQMPDPPPVTSAAFPLSTFPRTVTLSPHIRSCARRPRGSQRAGLPAPTADRPATHADLPEPLRSRTAEPHALDSPRRPRQPNASPLAAAPGTAATSTHTDRLPWN
jgi:hypothetical protein